MKNLIPQKIKNIYHLFQSILANIWYGFPSRNIKTIGVTGTNGKTTTAQMISRILEEAGKKVAMVSTINFKVDDKKWVNKTKLTTLSGFQIQKFIKKAIEAGCDYLVLETSSHALDQYRVWGIEYNVAVITNVTREHLDYHKTMEEYRQAKLKMFKKINTAIVNLDMEKPEDFLHNDAKEKYGYCTEISDFKFPVPNKLKTVVAVDMKLGINQSDYKLSIHGLPIDDWQNILFKLHIPGEFNVENALAATCVGISEGIDFDIIKNALEKIKGIPGRLERVPNDKDLNIIIDYALTPDSLKKVYKLISNIRDHLRKFASNPRIISVFGSCGERDRGKRPIMGKIVSDFADYIILTNEDPYNEDPQRIINEIAGGIAGKTEGKDFWKILDRQEAIKKALQIAKPGDIIMVTGKGAEETMAIGRKRIPWNDKKIIQEVLSKA